MSPWKWFAGSPGELTYDIAEEATRAAVIRAACRELAPGDEFQIVEARMSTSAKYEDAEQVPFVRQRNHETFTVGPQAHEARP